MVNDDIYEKITGKKRVNHVTEHFEELQHDKSFVEQFTLNTSPSKDDLQEAARILRINGYQVIKKRKNRK